jgi:ABC-type phosphate/phosphonate transport system substrate-binding protein
MKKHSYAILSIQILVAWMCCSLAVQAVDPYGPTDAKLTIVVMDPMAAPLACDCVQGYAQRKYEALGDYLREKTGASTRVIWAESIESASKSAGWKNADIVIGKDSVVRFDTQKNKLDLEPIASLTDTSGSTQQRGLFVVVRDSPVTSLLDIEGFKVLWGPEDCAEKSSAPKQTLKELEIETADGSVCQSCSIAAKELMALPQGSKTVAIISSYAAPLLEGCGTIKKGDLRVVGESSDVPFVSAFVSKSLPEAVRMKIQKSLLEMKSEPMLKALETKSGFVTYVSSKKK